MRLPELGQHATLGATWSGADRVNAGALRDATSSRPRPRSPSGLPQERLLWIKSWNEWAEGNYLEPDLAHGRGWLEALRSGLTKRAG